MYAAIELLYRDGVKVKPQWPPLVGQLASDRYKGAEVLYLWPMEWAEQAKEHYKPVAALWQPVFVRLGHSDLVIRGLEGVHRGPVRRWHVQKWICQVLDSQRARDYLKPTPSGAVEGQGYGPYPPHADPDRPFG